MPRTTWSVIRTARSRGVGALAPQWQNGSNRNNVVPLLFCSASPRGQPAGLACSVSSRSLFCGGFPTGVISRRGRRFRFGERLGELSEASPSAMGGRARCTRQVLNTTMRSLFHPSRCPALVHTADISSSPLFYTVLPGDDIRELKTPSSKNAAFNQCTAGGG